MLTSWHLLVSLSDGVRASLSVPQLLQGFFDALVKIPAEEGVMAMWKGLLPRLLRIPPGQAIVWAVSDQITGYVENKAAH